MVNDIKEFVKTGDVVKMKVLNIGEDGKVSLSIKRALEPERQTTQRTQGKAQLRCPENRRLVYLDSEKNRAAEL